jgi:hypothetical protein
MSLAFGGLFRRGNFVPLNLLLFAAFEIGAKRGGGALGTFFLGGFRAFRLVRHEGFS